MKLAPICVIAFNRPLHLKKVIESLKLNPEAQSSDLYLFMDGARSPKDEQMVSEVRSYASTISGFKSVNLENRPKNMGLAASVIDGVTQVLKNHENIIVLEDDLVVSPHFLSYMNEALSLYENEEKVASIHGYIYPVKTKLPETFFILGADCWGWATWRRGWKIFEADGVKLLQLLTEKKLKGKFDFNHSYPYVKMLEDQIVGKNNSWAIRWNASAFVNDMYTLYPRFSLVKNIGHDGSGENCDPSDEYEVNLSSEKIYLEKIKIEESSIGFHAFVKYFKSLKPNVLRRILNYIKRKM